MNFDHEELTLMMLYNTGTRLGLIHETGHRKTETADRCGVCRTGISPGLIIAAYGRYTYSLLQCGSMWYTEIDNSESDKGA